MYTSNILLFKNNFVYAFILNIRLLSAGGNFKGLRVFQGRDAERGEFPYAVALSLKSWSPGSTSSESFSTFCTGSIITPAWVLTAGHCIRTAQTFIDPSNKSSPNTKMYKSVIQYVSPLDNYNWTASNIIKTILHPNFKLSDIIKNDIGLVKVQNTTVTMFGKISPVHFGSMYGHKVFSLGLGLMKSESGQIEPAITLNKPLQVYDAIVTKCARNYRNKIASRTICLAWNCHKPSSSCKGDSGGAIIHPSGIVGVTTESYNIHCNTMENYFIASKATPVSPYVDWIARSIRENKF